MTKIYLEHILIIPRDSERIDVEIHTSSNGRFAGHMSVRVDLEGLYNTVFELMEKMQSGPNSWLRSTSDPKSTATAAHAWAMKRANIVI